MTEHHEHVQKAHPNVLAGLLFVLALVSIVGYLALAFASKDPHWGLLVCFAGCATGLNADFDDLYQQFRGPSV